MKRSLQKYAVRILILGCLIAVPGSMVFSQPDGNLDTDFPIEYELYLPGYKNVTREILEDGSENNIEAQEESGAESKSFFTSVKEIFQDRTVLNIMLLFLAFVVFLIYRLRYHKVRR